MRRILASTCSPPVIGCPTHGNGWIMDGIARVGHHFLAVVPQDAEHEENA